MNNDHDGINYIRILAGGYLVYLTVQLVRGLMSDAPPDRPVLVGTFAVIFGVVGGGLIVMEGIRYVKDKRSATVTDTEKEETASQEAITETVKTEEAK